MVEFIGVAILSLVGWATWEFLSMSAPRKIREIKAVIHLLLQVIGLVAMPATSVLLMAAMMHLGTTYGCPLALLVVGTAIVVTAIMVCGRFLGVELYYRRYPPWKIAEPAHAS